MIAGEDPLIRGISTFDFADDIPDGAELVILIGEDVDANAAGAVVIVERQRALPSLRDGGALKGTKDGRSVVIAERDGGNAGLIAAALDAGAVGEVGGGGDAWGLGSPEYFESIWTEPRWTAVSGRMGPWG